MAQDQQKENIKRMLPDYLKMLNISTKGNFSCLNPAHNDRTPSMSFDRQHEQVHCFGCNVTWDIFDLIALQELSIEPDSEGKLRYSFPEVFNKAVDILGLDYPKRGGQNHAKSEQQSQQISKAQNDIAGAAQYVIDQGNMQLSDKRYKNTILTDQLKHDHATGQAYLAKRGLDKSLIDRFQLGFIGSWVSYTAEQRGFHPQPSPRLIIPTSKTSYIARDTRDSSTLPEEERKYVKMKEGEVHIFNGQALSKNQPIFIVEGEIDALSIIETGKADAIGLGSVANIRIFMKELYSYKRQRKDFYPTLLIALDNDDAGKNAVNKLTAQLDRAHVAYHVVQIARGHKDANEALVADRAQFTQDIERILKDPDNRLQGLLDYINRQAEVQAIPTGFKNLDKVLDGGLYEGLYGIGAVSSLGKTTFALQIADHIAQFNQRPVLYFALEMGTYELMAKSISRISFERSKGKDSLAQTTRSILRGRWQERYNRDQYNNVIQSFQQYGDYYSNVVIHDGSEERPRIKDISNATGSYIARTGKKPVVIIDYLQIMRPMDERATDKANVTTSVNGMKKLATNYHIPVIVISSFNRMNYKNEVSMEAFKESGEIEYSTDVLIGLQFQGTGQQGFDFNEAKKAQPRQIEAVILKNRNGATGDKLNFAYYSMFNKFLDMDDEYEEPAQVKAQTKVDKDGRVISPQEGILFNDKIKYNQDTNMLLMPDGTWYTSSHLGEPKVKAELIRRINNGADWDDIDDLVDPPTSKQD